MVSQERLPVLLQAKIQSLRSDFSNLIAVFESGKIPEGYGALMVGQFNRLVSPLLHELEMVEERGSKVGEYAAAWNGLLQIQLRCQHLMEEAQELLGGLAIRNSKLDRKMSDRAQILAKKYAQWSGVSISPVVIIGQQHASDWPEEVAVEENEGDSVVRLPIPRWDIWYLPLIAHDCGFQAAKRGLLGSLKQFVDEQTGVMQRILDAAPPTKVEIAPFLPEVQALWKNACNGESDIKRFLENYAPTLNVLTKRQTVHLWHLISDGFATCIAGPAYVYALLFLALNPTDPFPEGEWATRTGKCQSRYMPADARRAALVFHVLGEMDRHAKTDQYTDGPYTSDLNLISSMWEHSLQISTNLEQYRRMQDEMRTWNTSIYDSLQYHFRLRMEHTAELWLEAKQRIVQVLVEGSTEIPPQDLDLPVLINAAWWCRSRHPEHIRTLEQDCERLLLGNQPPLGFATKSPKVEDGATRLLGSRLYDLETDLERLITLFNSEQLEQVDRDAVAGRFYRLLSKQDYNFKKLQKFVRMGNPLDSSLSQAINYSQGDEMRALQREVLDFLGGLLIRTKGIDQGICNLAEALLRDYARSTGVNWASRAIVGKKPLFSRASDMVHIRFPDWDIWNLPLLAHEFGHIVAFATLPLMDFLQEQRCTITKGHPELANWEEKRTQEYVARRESHIHEFFADAFAVYCQGPAFAYNVVVLHFNPTEAYLERGFHPTHAERMEVILKMLQEMNKQDTLSDYDSGCYAPVIRRLGDWWSEAFVEGMDGPGKEWQFHKLKAQGFAIKFHNILETYYRLGVRYSGIDWKRTDEKARHLLTNEPSLEDESLRDLLIIAWACRVHNPDRVTSITKILRKEYEQRM